VHFDRMIVLDFETTGLRPGYRPVEIAWIEFDDTLNETDQVQALVNPGIPIEPAAQQTHGITSTMLHDKPTLPDFLSSRHPGKFIDEHVLVVAHNAAYDVPMFAPYCKAVTSLCTMRLSQSLYPHAPDHRLETMADVLRVDVEPNHRALADAGACFSVLRAIATAHNLNLSDLIAASNRLGMDSVMPFGKHKGTPLRDLPPSYVNWCIENLAHDNWVRQALLSE